MKPLLKWAGCKTWLAPRLAAMYEPYRATHTWVEPFCGALGATLGVMPERAILSDVNGHLINLYRQINDGVPNNAQDWESTENLELGVLLFAQKNKAKILLYIASGSCVSPKFTHRDRLLRNTYRIATNC